MINDNKSKVTITIGKDQMMEIVNQINFLFVVHNDIEYELMREQLEPVDGKSNILRYVDSEGSKQVYWLGKFGAFSIALTKTPDMASLDVDAASNVVNSAINLWKPAFVIMVGVAAGLKDGCKIGDVVVSREILGYERVKIGTDNIIGRYPHLRSGRLYNLFDSILQCEYDRVLPSREDDCYYKLNSDLLGQKIRKGTIISGEKLLDNSTCRTQLKEEFPEAIALEMEGVGLASACIHNRVFDWIVVKAICDFGDGGKGNNKDQNQIFATRNAIALLRMVFDEVNNFSESEFKVDYEYAFRRNVLISGSQVADTYKKTNEIKDEETKSFCLELTQGLLKENYRITTGYGLGVGNYIVRGVMDYIKNTHRYPDNVVYDRYLSCFPFPRNAFSNNKQDALLEKCKYLNRELLVANTKIAIFIFGYKCDSKKQIVEADGMMEELELAARNNAFVVPVGATGGTAQSIFNEVVNSLHKYYPNRSENQLINIGDALKNLNIPTDLTKEKERTRLINDILTFINLR